MRLDIVSQRQKTKKAVQFRFQCVSIVAMDDDLVNRAPHAVQRLTLAEELSLPLVTHFHALDHLHTDCTCGSSKQLQKLRTMHTHSTKFDSLILLLLNYARRESSLTVSVRLQVMGVYDKVCQILSNFALTMSRHVTLRVLFQEMGRNPGAEVCDAKKRLLHSAAHLL